MLPDLEQITAGISLVKQAVSLWCNRQRVITWIETTAHPVWHSAYGKAQEVAGRHTPLQWTLIAATMGCFFTALVHQWFDLAPPLWTLPLPTFVFLAALALYAWDAGKAGYRWVRRAICPS